MKNTILNINEKQTVSSYPYGRLRTEAYFSIEFVKGKGFRSVFQTKNPKTDRLNAEKKSTYNNFMYQYIEQETGHIKTGGFNVNSFEAINKLCRFITENRETLCLTEDMIEEIALHAIAVSKISAAYSGVEFEVLKSIIAQPVKALVEIAKTKNEELFSTVVFDVHEIERNKKVTA